MQAAQWLPFTTINGRYAVVLASMVSLLSSGGREFDLNTDSIRDGGADGASKLVNC